MMKKQAEHQDNTAELKEAFKIFDRDGNGYIDAEELKKVTKFGA
jgi:calmodulin